MKKVITLCTLALALFIGTSSISAQSNSKEINAQAIKKTESLSKHLKLNEVQKDKIFLAFTEYGRYKMNIERGTIDTITIEKIEANLQATMKDVLTEEQFLKYQTLEE